MAALTYTTRPSTVTAMQCTGRNYKALGLFAGNAEVVSTRTAEIKFSTGGATIIHPTEWIVKFGVGLFMIMTDDAFTARYEAEK